MHQSKNLRRGFVVAVAAAGLLALGTGGAQASEEPSADGTLSGVAGMTHSAQHSLKDIGKTAKKSVHKTVRRVAGKAAPQNAGKGVQRNVGKAAAHATKEARKAVPGAPSAAAHPDLGAVSGVPAAAAAPSAPGLPKDLVIEIPQLVPGVPSIGILPSSLPALLPFTPSVPII